MLGLMSKYMVAALNSIEAVRCPCGWAKRAFGVPENTTATMHLVAIEEDSRVHYHRKMTELYLVLEGEGFMELDGERVAVRPMMAVFIPPGVRHRAVGRMKIINVPVPAFDAADEFED